MYQTWAGDNFKDVDDETAAKDSSANLEDTIHLSGKDRTPLLKNDHNAERDDVVDQNVTDTRYLPNSLDPHHTCYLFTDDGRRGQYRSEPKLRTELEKYIAHVKSLTIHGATGEMDTFRDRNIRQNRSHFTFAAA